MSKTKLYDPSRCLKNKSETLQDDNLSSTTMKQTQRILVKKSNKFEKKVLGKIDMDHLKKEVTV